MLYFFDAAPDAEPATTTATAATATAAPRSPMRLKRTFIPFLPPCFRFDHLLRLVGLDRMTLRPSRQALLNRSQAAARPLLLSDPVEQGPTIRSGASPCNA